MRTFLLSLTLALALASTSFAVPPAAAPADATAPPVAAEATATAAPTEAPAMQRAEPARPDEKKQPLEVHWVRNSAEYKAISISAYAELLRRLKESSKGLPAGSWGVILDADETVLDNSQYQRDLALKGETHTPQKFDAWCKKGEAGAVPGAKAALKAVKEMGGKVVIVTNRGVAVQPETETNFKALGIPYDLMLCKPTGAKSDKNPRFKAVEEGTAGKDFPKLQVLAWVGDNIQDFPNTRQDIRTKGEEAFADFSTRYVVIPNPMYGSWVGNPND